ncbi:hypothetical protein Leryth_016423 [Lithospermum erythrorhizon]|nr:hypothetical protein Leryth_016423 [Lithospermum erythrorhizon]
MKYGLSMSAVVNGAPLLSLSRRLSKQLHYPTVFRHQTVLHRFSKVSASRIRSFESDGAGSYEARNSRDTTNKSDLAAFDLLESPESVPASTGNSILAKLLILLGVAATITLLSIVLKQPNQGPSVGTLFVIERSSESASSTLTSGFTLNAFGYRIMIPEYAPGWIYFWMLMAAGCGLFISEEALNIWVGISLARLLTLDGTWKSLADSFSRNAPYIISTILWVYWGVCISDMIPFYIGKLFKRSGASEDVCSKLGIDKKKAMSIAGIVHKYGNVIGFVERFSLGVRNPTAFLAGALDISPDYFFAGVCCGGMVTLPIQLGIGFLMRERPVFALATVATVVGIWTIFPYALAILTAVFFYWRNRYSSIASNKD